MIDPTNDSDIDRAIADHARGAWDVSGAWDRAREVIEAAAPTAPLRPHVELRGRSRFSLGVVFSLGALLIFVGLLYYTGGVRRGASLGEKVYATNVGQRLRVTLVDGTQVTLGPASTLRVASRSVDLAGEAYFSVVHDSEHPFTVHADATTIRDIGTQFDVRDYATDTQVRVAVAEGEVSLSARSVPSAILRAGDLATVGASGVDVSHGVQVLALTNWRQGGLVFQNAPLSQVVQDLNRTFGLHVVIADTALAHARVTATFSIESSDEILDEITRDVGAHYTRNGAQVTIRQKTESIHNATTRAPVQPLRTARASQ